MGRSSGSSLGATGDVGDRVRRPTRPAGRLPTPLTAFVGRRSERAALADAVRSHRLVTTTGPGGVGKTRLGVAVADDLSAEFADGVTFVDLVGVAGDAMVATAVADAVGAPDRAGVSRLDAVAATLADREWLVVLDNCEHLLTGVRETVAGLLVVCESLRILATSRIRLFVAGETVFPVPGMSIAPASAGDPGDAVDLFAARSRASGMGDLVADGDVAVVRDICRSLDGMALAIELAAARAPSLGLDGLQRALGETHELLALAHPAGDRHGSLRAAIDWSYRLLDAEEQRVLRSVVGLRDIVRCRRSGHRRGSLTQRLLSVLGRLVDWNLVSLRPGMRTRYRVLETISQFATERSIELGELDIVRKRHLEWARAALGRLLEAAPGDLAWCGEVDLVLDDARAALGWSMSPGPANEALAGDLAELIAAVAFQRGRLGEAQMRYEQAAELAEDAPRRRSNLVTRGRHRARSVRRR